MKGSRLLLMVALACALMAVAGSTSADGLYLDLYVDTVSAAQYSYGYFFANASAHGSAQILDAHLLVNGVAVSGLQVEQYLTGDGTSAVWKFSRYGGVVVNPGDVLTIVVTDAIGHTAEKQVACIGSAKKKSALTAFCA